MYKRKLPPFICGTGGIKKILQSVQQFNK